MIFLWSPEKVGRTEESQASTEPIGHQGINCLFLSAWSSGEDQLKKPLFSSDYEFFKSALSMVIDNSSNGSQNRTK